MRRLIVLTITVPVFIFCGIVSNISFAQGSRNSDLDAMKSQLELMEDTIKKQQEMINGLKAKIETREKVVAKPTPSYREENEIERIVDDYLMKDETRKKMVKAGLTPE